MVLTKRQENLSKPYDYSDEFDMLNRIVLGMSAKQYREQNGIPKGEAIRPYLDKDEAQLLEYLMTIDIGLQYSMPDYQQRKNLLEWKSYKWRDEHRDVLIEDKPLAS